MAIWFIQQSVLELPEPPLSTTNARFPRLSLFSTFSSPPNQHAQKEKQGWIDWQDGMKKLLNSHVQELKQIEERSINPGPIYEAKRENLLLQQEAEYRRRLMEVYNEVKRKLDYQVAIEDAKKSFTRKHLVNWVIDSVNKNVNVDLEKAVLKQCVLDLKTLSEKRRNAI